jgi:protein-tyrosine phosphatase
LAWLGNPSRPAFRVSSMLRIAVPTATQVLLGHDPEDAAAEGDAASGLPRQDSIDSLASRGTAQGEQHGQQTAGLLRDSVACLCMWKVDCRVDDDDGLPVELDVFDFQTMNLADTVRRSGSFASLTDPPISARELPDQELEPLQRFQKSSCYVVCAVVSADVPLVADGLFSILPNRDPLQCYARSMSEPVTSHVTEFFGDGEPEELSPPRSLERIVRPVGLQRETPMQVSVWVWPGSSAGDSLVAATLGAATRLAKELRSSPVVRQFVGSCDTLLESCVYLEDARYKGDQKHLGVSTETMRILGDIASSSSRFSVLGRYREKFEPDPTFFGSWSADNMVRVFDPICSELTEYMCLGCRVPAENLEQLRSHGMTHVVNCAAMTCRTSFPEELTYKQLYLLDGTTQEIRSVLYDVFDFIDRTREQLGRVYVHCHQGVSRSACICIAYLMNSNGWPFQQAHEYVKKIRFTASPNAGFIGQLLEWHKAKRLHLEAHRVADNKESTKRERKEARQGLSPPLYRIAPQSHYDPFYLVPKIERPSRRSAELWSPHAQLDPRFVFVLDCSASHMTKHGQGPVVVWVGSESVPQAEEAVLRFIRQLVKQEGLNSKPLFVRQGTESATVCTLLGAPEAWSGNDVVQRANLDQEVTWIVEAHRNGRLARRA